jgi:beta-glucosidase
MKKSASAILSAAVLSCAALCAFGDPIVIGTQVPGSDHSSEPCTPKQHTGDYQTQHFNADISGSQGKEFDVVLFGDSITDFWNNPNLALDGNSNNYATSFNMGIGSERVQNILWRLRNGALDGYTTKYFTLMVGINNGHQKCIDHNEHADRAEDVAESIRLMLCEMATKHPNAKILLMPILPYSFDSKYFEAAEVTEMSEAVNDYILQFVDNKRVFWVDLRSQYLMQNSMPDKTCYREGGHGGYDAVGLCLHPEFFTYSDFWKPALTNAMHKYLSVDAGQAHVADPSLGYAKAAPNADGAGSATITVFGINLGTDANANAVTSYAIDYELDGGAKTRALSNQTGVRKSFVIPNVALGAHTCKVTVTTADNKELVTLLDFTMTEPWSAEPLPADASAVRTDGTLKYAYACGSYTLNGVTFAAAGNNNANISNDIVWPYSQTSGSTPPSTAASGNYYDLLGHCWWATQGDKEVTLKDLTPGHVYLVQIFGYRNYSGHDRSHVWIKESYWDSNYMKVLGDGWTYGGALTGTLTATEATKTFTIKSDGNYAVNGIQVRDLGESGVPVVVQPKVGSVTVTTNETAATVFLSGIVLGTDDAGEGANSYSVSYKLGDAASVTALTSQTGTSAQFTISDLADGEYTCAVTITTDANKTSAAKSVSFRIGTPPPEVVAASIGSASAATSGSAATISLSGVVMGTDDDGVAASSYSVSYSLNSGSAVAALSNQTGTSASFQIADLADGSYTCAVTITTDKGKVASKSVSFTINTSLPPVPVGSWTSGPMSADGSSIRTDGTLVYAFAAQDSTVGGVAFVRDLPLGASGKVSASPAPVTGNGSWGDDGTTGDFGELLRNGWNWTGDGNELSYTLTLNELTAGKTYLVQLIAHRQSNSMLVSANGSPTAHVHGSDESNCKYGASIVGVFVASGSSATVTVTYTNQTGDRPLNAIQVRELGEGGGGGGEDPIDPVDPATPVCALTIPAKTGLQLQSVTTNGVAVTAAGGSYSIVSNTQVTVTFAAASGYEITGGNPVVFTLSGNKTFVDADYPTVQATSGGGGGSVETGWSGGAADAEGTVFRTDGTLLYAYAVQAVTVNGISFAADADLNTADTAVSPDLAQTDGNSGSESVTGDFGTMLNNSWEWVNSTSTLTITLKGLTAGKRYLVQVLAHNKWSDALISAGELTPMAMRETNKYGASLVCVFDATGATEDIAVKYSGPAAWRVLNAIQVRELPADAPVEPDAPVIGGEGVDVPFAVSSDKVAITISNAASGLTYGYKKSVTLAGLKDASVVWFDDPADSDGVLTLEIPKDASEPSCFYQIVVE